MKISTIARDTTEIICGTARIALAVPTLAGVFGLCLIPGVKNGVLEFIDTFDDDKKNSEKEEQ